MAQSTVRIAARAGVVAASLLVLGPMPAHASADKHGSGSHSKHDNRNELLGSPNETLSNFANDVLGVDTPKSSITPPASHACMQKIRKGATITRSGFCRAAAAR